MKKLDFNAISFLILALMMLFGARVNAQYSKQNPVFWNKDKNYVSFEANIGCNLAMSLNPALGNQRLLDDKFKEKFDFEWLAKYSNGFKTGIGVEWMSTNLSTSDAPKKGFAFSLIAGYEFHNLRSKLNHSSILFGIAKGNALNEVVADDFTSHPVAHTLGGWGRVMIPLCPLKDRRHNYGKIDFVVGVRYIAYSGYRYPNEETPDSPHHSEQVLKNIEFDQFMVSAGILFNLRATEKWRRVGK